MQQLEHDIKALIISSLALEDITPDDIASDEPLFVNGLGLDSIDALELGLALQKRYGETARCLDLLVAQVRGEPLSPTAFALSVHNAMGAMIALVREDRNNSSAIAAGRMTAAAGVTEAVALLDDGARVVDLVVYDAPLPGNYAPFADEPAAHFAWAWRLRHPRAGEPALRLDWQADDAATDDATRDATKERTAALPASLQAMWFALSGAPAFEQRTGGQRCLWSRDA